jgi:hypothetical protein
VEATVFATKQYEREAKRLLDRAEIAAMETSIAADPEAHPVVTGTGGIRKARWARQGKGKSGGVRVIYYFWSADNEVYMLFVYAKKDQDDLDADSRKAAKKFIEDLKNAKQKRGQGRSPSKS